MKPIRTFVFIVQKCKGLNFCTGNIIRLEFLSIVIANSQRECGNLILKIASRCFGQLNAMVMLSF